MLMGKVLRNINDDPDQGELRKQEAEMLDHTLAALTNVTLQEGRNRGVGVCSPSTLCFRYVNQVNLR